MPIGGRSDVYLVSATRFGDPRMQTEYDNRAYEDAATLPRKDAETFVAPKEYSEKPYRGMGKDELLIHSSKPFWRRLRMVLVVIIILAWLALIATVVALIIVYPRCKPAPSREWWQTSPIYRIYTESFQDSDGDGFGDLNGIKSRISYFNDIGVKIISISSIYKSDGTGNDFNIVNHKAIEETRYGTMDDFKALVNATHEAGLYLIMDFIPNHTSDKHQWFTSSKDINSYYKNYYVWNNEQKPNNWVSVYGNSAWEFNSDRNQTYLHQFQASQPDLNLRNSKVTDDLEEILKFWLELGVDGFYVRHSAYLYEDYDLRDEIMSPSKPVSSSTNDYDYYKHDYTYAQNDVYDMLARWRSYLNEFGKSSGRYRLLFADIDGRGNIDTVMKYYHNYGADCTNYPLNQMFLDDASPACTGNCASTKVNEWMKSMPSGQWPNWVTGLDNTMRLSERKGENYTRAFYMLSMLMPGTPVVYYGDEINMQGAGVTTEPWLQRQSMRAPMKWSNATSGGFCKDCTPWMSTANGDENVQLQNTTDGSLLKYFKELTSLRTEPSFQHGAYYPAVIDDSVVSFVREWDGETGYLVAINFGSDTVTRDFRGSHSTIAEETTVAQVTGGDVQYEVEGTLAPNDMKLGPLQGIVLSWDFVAKDL